MQKPSKTKKITLTIDQYIKGFPKNTQILLKQMQAIIQKVAPGATEGISYGMPSFTFHGKYLVYFGGWKNHIGFYPIPSGLKAFEKELSKYKRAKGSVRFPLDKPLPVSLITKIVKFRAKENLALAKK